MYTYGNMKFNAIFIHQCSVTSSYDNKTINLIKSVLYKMYY